jgi:hypothetical protein
VITRADFCNFFFLTFAITETPQDSALPASDRQTFSSPN